ncbi:MAG: hypothetical protein HRU70_12775 [Phycisphaeraceae bacterium]|nr:MAG: hypothetical protein HRU70_12775 [Phycisphaeraceae bacterium]
MITMLVAAALWSPAPSLAAGDEPVRLAWSWKAGDATTYTSTFVQEVVATGQVESKNRTEQRMTHTLAVVKTTDGGGALVEQTIRALAIDTESPMGAMKFDTQATDDEGNAPAFKFFSTLVGASVRLTVGPEGEVTEIEGLEKLLTQSASPGESAVTSQARLMFSDDTMKRTAEQFFGVLPGREVKPGESWTRTINNKVPTLGVITTTSTYTYAGAATHRDSPAARITVASKSTLTQDTETPMSRVFTITLEGGDGAGEILVDPSTSRPITGSVKSEILILVTPKQEGSPLKPIRQTVKAENRFERADPARPADAISPSAP